eukprot:m51a1_g6212 hypothetical protein (84) ;mRNA; f:174837-179211
MGAGRVEVQAKLFSADTVLPFSSTDRVTVFPAGLSLNVPSRCDALTEDTLFVDPLKLAERVKIAKLLAAVVHENQSAGVDGPE